MAISALKNIFLLWVCLTLPSIYAKPVKYCDRKGNYAVKVKGVEFEPDPVKPGEAAVFKIYASSGEEISAGTVVIDVSYFGVHVHEEKIDLCQETSCPISAGNFVLSHSQTLPVFTPPGLYTLKMQVQGSGDSVLTCVSFKFKIGFGSSVSAI